MEYPEKNLLLLHVNCCELSVSLICAVCRWYHGRLDRNAAEDRLRQAGHIGGYLIRKSERNLGSYALSFLGQKGMNHFRYVCTVTVCTWPALSKL